MPNNQDFELCPKCERDILFTCTEREERMCYRCIDRAIEHANERAEWRHFHGG